MLTFTIATVTYNAERTLERTLQSILSQTYQQIEFLLIDGASKDNTVAIYHNYDAMLRTYCLSGVKMSSKPDKGIYDAMNKALMQASGDYIIFLNAGDTFHSPTTLQEANDRVLSTGVMPDVIYGQTEVVNNDCTIRRPRHYTAPDTLTARSFSRGMLVCHQAFWVRVPIAKSILYDTQYRYSADYDWCVRIIKQSKALFYTGLVLINYLDEGMTTLNHRASLIERYKIMCRHYGVLRTVSAHLKMLVRSFK